MHFLTIAHCNEGKLDYKKVLRTQSNKFIDWDVPFCLLKPSVSENVVGMNQYQSSVKAPSKSQGQKNGELDYDSFVNVGGRYTNTSTSQEQQKQQLYSHHQTQGVSSTVLKMVKHKSGQVNQLLRKKFDSAMEKLTNGKWIEYSGRNKNTFKIDQQHHQEGETSQSLQSDTYDKLAGTFNNCNQQEQQQQQQQQSTGRLAYSSSSSSSPLHTALTQEINNLICFKMARHKRYAKRKISFFMPYTFVGAIFECLIPLDQKHEILQSMLINSQSAHHHKHRSSQQLHHSHHSGQRLQSNHNEFFMVSQSFQIKCDTHLSRPIAPLIAEDSTKQWFENKFHHLLNPKFIQTIPYLTTPTPPAPPSSTSKAASAAWTLLQQPLHLLTTPLKILGFPITSPNNAMWSSLSTPTSTSTSSSSSFAFAFAFASFLADTSWADKIDVNEDYNYNEIDLHLISKIVAYSANILNQLIAPFDFNGLVKGYNRANANEREDVQSATSTQNGDFPQDETDIHSQSPSAHANCSSNDDGTSSKGLSWDQKVSYWLASLNEKYVNRILLQIESNWDRLDFD
ncbi:hypothetical protein KGF57_004433 [Candida theae]|uniref:Uncharacterized protein n=1 Tax=Candida theae TaxID=1198502 RepID=A0AAD5BC98_9ASCO|nr:uncharacterized protein KGF57_004433 [Candida theae]KAI5950087.1 hypothetical protein KGF57_004433 [Candida theae]